MLYEILPVTRQRIYLIYKDKERQVKERTIYFFPTKDNIINICKYAKSEGADYICYKYNGPFFSFIPVLSTDEFDCVAIIRISDFSDDNIRKCVINAIEKKDNYKRSVYLRYNISPVKTSRIIEEMKQCGFQKYIY